MQAMLAVLALLALLALLASLALLELSAQPPSSPAAPAALKVSDAVWPRVGACHAREMTRLIIVLLLISIYESVSPPPGRALASQMWVPTAQPALRGPADQLFRGCTHLYWINVETSIPRQP